MHKDQNTGPRRECTIQERVNIIALDAKGFSQVAIVKSEGVARRTVQRVLVSFFFFFDSCSHLAYAIAGQRVLEQWNQSKQLEGTPRYGRPPSGTICTVG